MFTLNDAFLPVTLQEEAPKGEDCNALANGYGQDASIPPKSSRKSLRDFDREMYKARHGDGRTDELV
jgi:hypothetical protein